MNRTFDYNGSLVAPSKPVRALRTVKKTLHIDSADRDIQKYYTNGDVVYYLPRVYENVVSIRLKAATFQTPIVFQQPSPAIPQARTHAYVNGQNVGTATWASAPGEGVVAPGNNYFVVEIDGLNKTDETSVSADRSTYPDSFFAKIPINLSQSMQEMSTNLPFYFVNYNDHTEEENIARYSPAIGKLDRLHVVTRLHSQQGKKGFIYWTRDGAPASKDPNPKTTNVIGADYSLTFEIEYLDNVFDDFSSFETRVGDRADGFSRA